MSFFKVAFAVPLLVAALIHMSPGEAAPQQIAGGNDPFSPAIYTYSYETVDANSGNQFGHGEERDGDVTQGTYRVLMPDGRTQVVQYTVNGESGYEANVSYE